MDTPNKFLQVIVSSGFNFKGMVLKTLDTNHLHEIYRRFLKGDKKYPTCTIVRHKILHIKSPMLRYTMKIDYDCKQLIRLREEKGFDVDGSLAATMSLTTNHLIALEKNNVSFYRSEVLFLTSLKKYITLLGGNPKVMIKNIKELEQRKLTKEIEQPSQKRSWWKKIADDWLL
ncbi:hypothetical protein OAO78_02670 [Methylophilaceae bacterium]|nr:hypothetical protein [Methylophilaceae bacterium]